MQIVYNGILLWDITDGWSLGERGFWFVIIDEGMGRCTAKRGYAGIGNLLTTTKL
jgi:hypothetical protein